MRKRTSWLAAGLFLLGVPAYAAPGDTELVSQLEGAPAVRTDPNGLNSLDGVRTISSDGRYVAFSSVADNLVSGDTNNQFDIFVHDRDTGAIIRVSVDSAGMQANGPTNFPAISADGRYVAFTSHSLTDNLVSGDTNGEQDVLVHDRDTGTTTRVSVDSAGTQANGSSFESSISADGRYVAFVSAADNLVGGDTNGEQDVFVHDRSTGTTTRVSVDSAGTQANGSSFEPSVSADGRYITFDSDASNLVTGDSNFVSDIFVHDRDTGATTRVSVDSAGTQANGFSGAPSISADGRYVAFHSVASNLISGDTNNQFDIFVHDRETGTTTRVSVDSAGMQANSSTNFPAISADGRYVAFTSHSLTDNLVSGDTNGEQDILVHDRSTGATTRVSVDSAGMQANDSSFESSISADGRYVAFESAADNLVSGDTNEDEDVFVHDRDTGATERIAEVQPYMLYGGNEDSSLAPGRAQVSADGRYVAFGSDASNLVSGDTNDAEDIFVRDRASGMTMRVSIDSAGVQANDGSEDPTISADGRYVAFESFANNLVGGDTNGEEDIFVHDHDTGATTRVNVNSAGTQANDDSGDPSISADGRYVAFESQADNLVSGDTNGREDIFVRDRDTGATTRVSVDNAGTQANGSSFDPSISADGRYVAFQSSASNLISGDTNAADDIFVHDRNTGATTRLSVGSAGTQANDFSVDPSISGDGRYVAFESAAGNLVSGDTNGEEDIFVHDRLMGITTRVNVDSAGNQANADSDEPSISADGRFVAFESDADNLVSGDTNTVKDVFVRDLASGVTTRVSVDSNGVQGNNASFDSSISSDGSYVAFDSAANNLTPDTPDANNETDVFLHELADIDTDNDSVPDAEDNCPAVANAGQADGDGDEVGDACDNCVNDANPDQCNTNPGEDGFGNLCDADLDNDGGVTQTDLGLFRSQFNSTGTGIDADLDCDGGVTQTDLGLFRGRYNQPPG